MKSANFLRLSAIALLLAGHASWATTCDVDDNQVIDSLDIKQIMLARNRPASGADDPRDANADGTINALDIRLCTSQCTLAACAIPPSNTVPVANAGNDRALEIGSIVLLDGTASSDADGDALQYHWTTLALPPGSVASLSDPSLPNPSFILDVSGEYRFSLVVNDGKIDSAADEVLISTQNTPPVANAGPDKAGSLFANIVLDGSASDDANNDPLSFHWQFKQQPEGSQAQLDNDTAVMPRFMIDQYGDYVLQLVVNDGYIDSSPDEVVVSTLNTRPVADAGPKQTSKVGNTVSLDGSQSSDVDGQSLSYQWSFTLRPSGSTADLNDASSVTPQFQLDVAGMYILQLIVNDGIDASLPDTVTIDTANSAPIANAGPDLSREVGQSAQLDGSASSDMDGDSLIYQWRFVSKPSGSAAALDDANSVSPRFTLDASGDYWLELVVNDGSVDSASDSVVVTTLNSPPVANAGADQRPAVGSTVTLDGSASSDVNGDSLSYAWRFIDNPGGSNVSLDDVNAVTPQFTVDLPGSYELELVVNDGLLNSAPDTVKITTSNSVPTANAGANQSARVGQTVRLDGSASADIDGDSLRFAWSILNKPASSLATLDDPSLSMPSFELDVAGNYQLQLIVNDGKLDSAPDTTLVSTDNSAPLADAGANQSPFVGDVVSLDGSASSDVDGDPLSFSWSFLSKPAGSLTQLDDETAVTPRFTVDSAGEYIAQLIVSDGVLDSAPDTVQLNTANSRPVANAGPDQRQDVGSTVILDGSASNDVDGDSLSFMWNLTGKPAASQATLDDNSLITPSFILDLPGEYSVQLMVNDGLLSSSADTVIVSTNNVRPVANAGVDQILAVGSLAILDAIASSDADGDTLTYRWSISSKPATSATSLSSLTDQQTSLTLDVVGSYLVQLIVNDGSLDSVADSVLLKTENRPPLANAGSDISAKVNELLRLDGSGSSDPDGDPLSYQWQIVTRPVSSSATLDNDNSVNPGITPDVAGVYEFELRVFDGVLSSEVDSVSVNVAAPDPQLDLRLSSSWVGVGRSIDASLSIPDVAPSGGLVIDLSSEQSSIASVPAQVTIAEGESQVTFAATGVSSGTTLITARSGGYQSDSANLQTTTAVINLGNPGSLAPGLSTDLVVALSQPAPVGGVTVNFSSSNPAIAEVMQSVFIAEGSQLPSENAKIVAEQLGEASITASAEGYAPDSVDVTVSISLSITPSSLNVVQGLSKTATLSLSAPAPSGGLRVELHSSDGLVASVDSELTVPAGQLSSRFDVTGLAVGASQITAKVEDIESNVLSVNITPPPPIYANNVLLGKDQQATWSVSLGATPTSPTTLSVSIDDPSIAVVSDNATLLGAQSIELSNVVNTSGQTLYIHGLQQGSTTVTVSAPGYADATYTIDVWPSGFIEASYSYRNLTTTTFSAPTNLLVYTAVLYPDSASNAGDVYTYGYALRAGINELDVVVSSTDTSVGEIGQSPLRFVAGDTYRSATFNPLGAGTTTVQVVPPEGFNQPNSKPGAYDAEFAVTVTAPDIYANNVIIGKDQQVTWSSYLDATPPSGTTITATIADPSVAVISLDNLVLGAGSAQINNVTNTNAVQWYVQGLREGSTTITLSAAGYRDVSYTIDVWPSSFIESSYSYRNLSTTTFSSDTPLSIYTAVVYPSSASNAGDVYTFGYALRAGLDDVEVAVTSSDSAVGQISESPLLFRAGDSQRNTAFDPIGAGTSTVQIVQPDGFTSPTSKPGYYGARIEVSVTAPSINANNVIIGKGQQTTFYSYLGATPPEPTTVTVTIDDPSIALVSTDANTVGSDNAQRSGISSTAGQTWYIQGLQEGTTTVSVTAPGYAQATYEINVWPSGFVEANYSYRNLTTTTFSDNTSLSVATSVLYPASAANAGDVYTAGYPLRAGVSPVAVQVTSTDTNVGIITASPVVFNAGEGTKPTAFDPLATGNTTLTVVQPSGFVAANYRSGNYNTTINAVVSAPVLGVYGVIVGKDLQTVSGVSLQVAPPQPTDVEVCSSAIAVFLLSTSATEVGSQCVTFEGVTTTYVGELYVQGLSQGSAQISATALGYSSASATVEVYASGFGFGRTNYTASLSASSNLVDIGVFALDSSSNYYANQALRPGVSATVSFISSDSSVGEQTEPAVFNPGDAYIQVPFTAKQSGTIGLSMQVPSGFSAPNTYSLATMQVTP